MPKCEMCGNDFTPSSGAVSSLRILCPACAAKRQAAKAAAARPAAPAPPRPAPAGPARPAPASRPAAPPATATRVAAPTAARPAPRAEPRRGAEAPHHAHPIPGKPERDPVIMFGWIAAAVLIIVGGGIVFVIKGKKDRERAAIQARDTRLQEILRVLRSKNLDNEADCAAGKKFAEETEKEWRDSEIAADVESLVARFVSSLEILKDRREYRDRLANIEERLKSPEKVPVEEMREIRRKLEELEQQGTKVGTEFVTAVGQTRNNFDRVYAIRLREDPKAFAAANPDKGLGSLARYKDAEDELLKLVERAYGSHVKEALEYFEGQYKEFLAESDALCASVFTPEVIARTPWKDLLTSEMKKEWNASSVEGFSWLIDKGTLRIEGTPKGSGKKGILSIGDRDKWRDFVLEFEVTFESGDVDLFVRLGQHADRRAMSISLAVSPNGFTAG